MGLMGAGGGEEELSLRAVVELPDCEPLTAIPATANKEDKVQIKNPPDIKPAYHPPEQFSPTDNDAMMMTGFQRPYTPQ